MNTLYPISEPRSFYNERVGHWQRSGSNLIISNGL